MTPPIRTCGILIWRNEQIETCGARMTHSVEVRGDILIGICSRHRKRLEKAFPELAR